VLALSSFVQTNRSDITKGKFADYLNTPNFRVRISCRYMSYGLFSRT